MKKLILVSLLLLTYVFLLPRCNFRYPSIHASLFFHLGIFLAVLLAVEAGHRLFRTGSKKRKDIRVLLVVLFSLIIILEILLRFGLKRNVNYMEANKGWYLSQYTNDHASWYYVHFPGVTFVECKKEFQFEYQVNSEGLLDWRHSKAKATGEFRIVALGDSFTEGVGAEQGSSWPAKLEHVLNEGQSDRKFTVINAGISGSDPFFEYVLLRDGLLQYRPDLVIVAVNDSDTSEFTVRGGMERFQPGGRVVYRKGPTWEWLYSLSFITRVVVHDILGYNLNLRKRSGWMKDMMAAKERIHSCLRSFNDLAAREGFRLLVVFHPMHWEIAVRQMVLSDLAARLRAEPGAEVLDLLEYYLQKERISQVNSSKYYWRIDQHHNAAGYAAFARGVAWKLRQMGIAP
jgi:lysophospholipase L1-like esterase